MKSLKDFEVCPMSFHTRVSQACTINQCSRWMDDIQVFSRRKLQVHQHNLVVFLKNMSTELVLVTCSTHLIMI